jgi:FecR-like protein
MKMVSATTVLMFLFALAGGAAAQQSAPTTDSESATSTEQKTAPPSAPVSPPQAGEATPSIVPEPPDDDDNGAQPGDSHVRIVRLSDVKGMVAMDRLTGKGFEPTMQNMPVIEGAKLATHQGIAEIEFEDGSTMRVVPNSMVEFPQLALRSSGAKATTVRVESGTVYVNLEKTKNNEFTLMAGSAKMTVSPATHLRVRMEGPKAVLSVFAGDVAFESSGTTTTVEKKRTLTFDLAGTDKVEVAKGISEE